MSDLRNGGQILLNRCDRGLSSLCGQDVELVWTDVGGGATQTGPILLYLAEKYGRLGGESAQDRFEILRWLFWDNQKLSGQTATYRFLRAFTTAPDPAVLAWLRGRVDDHLGILDTHLKTRPFVVGAAPIVVDISMCAYLSFPEDEADFDLRRTHPHVRHWLDRLSEVPGWAPPYSLLPGQRMPRVR